MKNLLLYNGVEIPEIGYGTYKTPEGQVCVEGVKHALKTGYRHIDTAAFYANENSVKEGIIASDICPDDIFVTTKLWNCDHGYDNALRAFDKSSINLGKSVIDLYLIHWPIPYALKNNWQKSLIETWSAFERLYKEGRVKAIGVCNCLPHHLIPIIDNCEIKPMVNQIEMHIGYPENDVLSFCKSNNILVEAWAPIAKAKAFSSKEVLSIAKKYSKTEAQIFIRYCIDKGALPLPKSVTPCRIEENFNVFDFSLSECDIEFLDNLSIAGRLGSHPDDCKF